MLTKEITYKDFEGNERTDVCHFNMTKAEMVEYNAAFREFGGVIDYLTYLMKEGKEDKIIAAFKDLILRSYGERTANGRFIKSQELRDCFMATEAYSELFMEITSGEAEAAAFINGIMPKIDTKPSNVTSIPAPPLG